MTAKEHNLMIHMFTDQALAIKALIEILKTREVIEDGDFLAFASLVSQSRTLRSSVEDQVGADYLAAAKVLDITTGLDHPPLEP